MTILSPTLYVSRLVVMKGAKPVINLEFHQGLNVIRGENSAGKTTIIRFLAYGLGSEGIKFNQTARSCSQVLVEVDANGAVLTLKRDITESTLSPLTIFWGSLVEAQQAPYSAWQQYPFKRSESKVSFSQILFGALNLPELRGEAGSNITMHQLLRLIYSDQESPATDLFRIERFDSPLTRNAVGNYLLGVDDNEIYELRLQAAAIEKELGKIVGDLRVVFHTLGKSGTEISTEFLDQRIVSLKDSLQKLHSERQNIREKPDTISVATNRDESLRKDLSIIHQELSEANSKRLRIIEEISDTELFLKEMNDRLSSADESVSAANYFGTAMFSFCPSCFSKIDGSHPEGTCHLCKSVVTRDSVKSQLARMRNELALQVRESTSLIQGSRSELTELERKIPDLTSKLQSLELEFRSQQINWRSESEISIDEVSRKIGQTEQEILNTNELRKLASLLSEQTATRDNLNSDLSKIRDRIERLNISKESKRLEAYNAVAEALRYLLHNDLTRQPEFEIAEDVSFDFASNRITVDQQSQFSASSMVYLRHSFHLSLLMASTTHSYFRFPRIVIIDGIEDGGMEPDRSFNFQKQVRDVSESILASDPPIDHQIIVTTAHIWPEIENAKYVVGDSYTHDNRSVSE